MNDYERISRVIHHLDAHYPSQPDLSELAQCAGLSPFHFHRLFSKWAGVTPKDFVQCLTVAHVKELLRQGESVLDAAFDAGLSGPSRAHDLCVTLEAASPGEIKSGGAGCTIEAGFASSPFGLSLIADSARGICHLSFLEFGDEEGAWGALRADWPNAQFQRDDRVAAALVRRIFDKRSGSGSSGTLRMFVRATSFQVQVWRALLRVPPGRLITYGQLAACVGKPAASRAVGTAVGRNPIAYLIPCHRVIRATGLIGEYRWGQVRKRALVAWESVSEPGPSPVL